jgi:hypothetical protein
VAAAAVAPASAPAAVQVKCVRVKDLDLFQRFTGWIQNSSRGTMQTGGKPGTACNPNDDEGKATLVGAGDLEIVVDRASFETLLRQQQPGQIQLFLNGVALEKDAALWAPENEGDNTYLRYRISQGEETQKLWSMLYTDKGLFKADDLRVAFAWVPAGGATPVPLPERPSARPMPKIAISTGWQLTAALALLALLVGVIVFAMRATDAARDAIPGWLNRGLRLRARWEKYTDAQVQVELLKEYPSYDATKMDRYRAIAEEGLRGNELARADEDAATIGVILQPRDWVAERSSYSLTKVQLALWFTFAVATGLFLWVLYGDLRRIDGSLVALLGISIVGATVSWATDRTAGGRPYSPTRGFWQDLVTGFDEQHQVHRYQAVVVNLLLLFVGVFHVLQQLTYPVFDATWLLFLGVSSAALGVGKQMVEKPRNG